ncbi:MAG: cobalamin B12-binding domain-containing protein [Actinobacteria bacterium]|nr:cobalamin B12-binding domain-containing protein [Actinomycetota bacterium]
MKKILGASIGSCVHVAGIINFLNIASKLGYNTKYIGSAIDIERLDKAIKDFKPEIVGVSYRLSPESSEELFRDLQNRIIYLNKDISFIIGTTASVADFLKEKKLLDKFDIVFTGGESTEYVEKYLKGKKSEGIIGKKLPQKLIERISFKSPYPLLRHHFGRPTMKETIDGIRKISESGLLDVVSIGPDQNAQEFFFNPEKMDRQQDGAGGVPVRSEADLASLYAASRTGNYPLMRCYSGTNDVLKFAEILLKNINNAWCAIPLCWYNEIDNRSQRGLETAIRENQQVMAWHGKKGVPVEVNESHHWSLRYSSDSIAVAAAYLAAYNAKKMGVNHYVSQYMFNTPPETSFIMDLAKMLAKVEMIESLHDDDFHTYRETRTGLYSMPADFNEGKGQLASSTMLQMQLSPSIVHVVAYCESSYAAKPEDIIESCGIVHKVIENCIYGIPDMKIDINVSARKNTLINDAGLILKKIKDLDSDKKYEDPLSEPAIIAESIKRGILDAPHLAGVKAACGKLKTMFFDGACLAVDDCANMISEEERLEKIS